MIELDTVVSINIGTNLKFHYFLDFHISFLKIELFIIFCEVYV